MTVQLVTANVVEVLSRAESLFATPGDAAASGTADTMGQAAEASRMIAAHAEELSGSVGTAYSELATSAAQHLEHAAGTDAALADQLARAAATHGGGASLAAALRAGAAEVPARLGPWADLPAGELAGLVALRNKLSGMQRLLAEHSGEAARAAEAIRGLGYRQ